VEYSSHRKAIDVGKPSRTLFDLIQSKVTLDVRRTVFVGDRLDTDIRFGVDHGMKSVLVLTGVTNVDVLRRIHTGTVEEPIPNAIISHVGLMGNS
jgi:ribonucleotide monophosphatase NagD (HAD superfamily)